MIDEVALMARITTAQAAVEAAQRNVPPYDDGSADHLRAQILYLQAKVHHMALLAVMQAGQQQRLWEEIERLRQEMKGPRLH